MLHDLSLVNPTSSSVSKVENTQTYHNELILTVQNIVWVHFYSSECCMSHLTLLKHVVTVWYTCRSWSDAGDRCGRRVEVHPSGPRAVSPAV